LPDVIICILTVSIGAVAVLLSAPAPQHLWLGQLRPAYELTAANQVKSKQVGEQQPLRAAKGWLLLLASTTSVTPPAQAWKRGQRPAARLGCADGQQARTSECAGQETPNVHRQHQQRLPRAGLQLRPQAGQRPLRRGVQPPAHAPSRPRRGVPGRRRGRPQRAAGMARTATLPLRRRLPLKREVCWPQRRGAGRRAGGQPQPPGLRPHARAGRGWRRRTVASAAPAALGPVPGHTHLQLLRLAKLCALRCPRPL
jgi:hypothetical protein